MKKLLPLFLSALVAVPAVALATGGASAEQNSRAQSVDARVDAHYKARAQRRVAAERRRHERLARRRRRQRRAAHASTASPLMQAIAACESGGNPRAIGGGGAYRGKYQFDRGTWASVGGSGDPAAAPESEQDRRAAMLYARVGSSAWPVCGQ